MKDFLKHIFQYPNVKSSKQVDADFKKRFPYASHIEWHLHGKIFEAIFIDDGKEKITRFEDDGTYIDTKVNLSLESVPLFVKENIKSMGELMNAIEIETGSDTYYELIIKENQQRYLLSLSEKGELLEKKRM